MKKILVLTLVLVMVLSLGLTSAFAADSADVEKTYRVGCTLYSLKNEFTVRLANAAQAKCDELGIELEVYDGDYDAATMIGQVETMIANGVDGIIMDPIDADACATAVDIAIENDVPMVGVNAMVNHPDLLSYVGSQDVTAGEGEMQYMADFLGGKGKIVIIEGPLGQSAQLERREGIDNILEKYPDIEVLASQTGNWSRAEGMTLMENWLNTFEQIDGIVGENDEMALGALQAAEAQGLNIPAVGVDGITDALNEIKKDGSNFIASMFQDAWGQGQMSVEVLYAAMNGEDVEQFYWIPFELITAENVDDFLARNQ